MGLWIRVARPDDWTGTLARVTVFVLLLMLLPVALLVRLPVVLIEAAYGHPEWVRVLLVFVSFGLVWVVRFVLVARLPRAPVLRGRKLTVHDGIRRRRLRTEDVAVVDVELRPAPAHEVFVLRLRDGTEVDLCPVHWAGAAVLYAKLVRRIGSGPSGRASGTVGT